MEIEAQYSDFMIARRPDRWYGVINKQGETVLPFDYWSMTRIPAGAVLAGIKGEGKGWGLLNSRGEVLVPLEYKFGQSYPDSTVVFLAPGNQKIVNVLDADRVQVVMEGTFEDMGKEPGKRPLVTVKENGLWGLMDYNKRLLVPCVYDKIHMVNDSHVIAEKAGKWGVVNFQNMELIPFVHDMISERMRYGCYRTGKKLASGNYLWGLTDTTGQTILASEYDMIEQAYHCDFFRIKKGGKAGLTDATGKVQIPLQFGEIYEAKHRLFQEKTTEDGKKRKIVQDGYGLYFKTKDTASDKLGLWYVETGAILKPLYESVEVLEVGGPYEATQNGKKALITSEGKPLTDFEYAWLNVDSKRPTLVKAGLPDQKIRLLRLSDGKPINDELYDEIPNLGNDESLYFLTKKDRLAALHQPDGKRITPHKYTTIHACDQPLTDVVVPKGRTIVACAYLANSSGIFFFALDDAGAEYAYTRK
jgi:hypothetical protein